MQNTKVTPAQGAAQQKQQTDDALDTLEANKPKNASKQTWLSLITTTLTTVKLMLLLKELYDWLSELLP